MLAVTEINYIRYEANQKGDSYADIGRRMKIDARTVSKYANQEEFKSRKKQTRRSPVMDPVKPIIEKWINEDLKKKKKELKAYVEEAALPLESIPGTAQVDFGEAPFIYQSKVIDLPYLVMSFPYSNTFYFQVFPSENTECLLEGLQRMFHYMGGVPHTIRFDNLSPAVKKIGAKGERELTNTFERFVLHYGFKYEFCNPGKGNEKGHVEAMVKYVRNNFLLPECTILDLDHFNETLWTLAKEDRSRIHYDKGILQTQLHSEDKDEWLIPPVKSYDCVRHETLTADKYGMVSVDNKLYSTSPRFARQKVNVHITYNSVVILNDHNEVIVRHNRLYGIKRKSMIWQPYLDLLSRRPRAIKYSSLYEQFPPVWTEYLNRCTEHEQKEALQLLGKLLKNNDFELLNQALELAMGHGHPKADHIKHCFYSIIQGNNSYQTIKPTMKVPIVPAATRGLSHYDSLMETGDRIK